MTTVSQENKELRSMNNRRLEIMNSQIIGLNTLMNSKCLSKANQSYNDIRKLDTIVGTQIQGLQSSLVKLEGPVIEEIRNVRIENQVLVREMDRL